MEFCNKCGKPLSIKKDNEIIYGICKCGFKKLLAYSGLGYNKKSEIILKGEGVLEERDNDNGFPHICKKCGCELAEVYDLGAHYSDEANIILFKCIKCGYSERQSDGTGN